MPVLLLLDTCGATGYVAAIDTAWPLQPLASQALPGRETQELLLSAIATVLEKAQLATAALAAVAVVTGPGSFTGVRIGLAAAKGLAEACNLPLLALSRLAVLVEAARRRTGADRITIWIDAGRTDVYAAAWPGTQEAMLPRAAALQAAADSTLAVEDPALAALFPGSVGLSTEEIQRACAILGAARFARQEFADTALLDANYLRVPDAEIALRARRVSATVAAAVTA